MNTSDLFECLYLCAFACNKCLRQHPMVEMSRPKGILPLLPLPLQTACFTMPHPFSFLLFALPDIYLWPRFDRDDRVHTKKDSSFLPWPLNRVITTPIMSTQHLTTDCTCNLSLLVDHLFLHHY